MTDLFTPEQRHLQARRLAAIMNVELDKAIYRNDPEALDTSQRQHEARIAAIDAEYREETRRKLIEAGYDPEEIDREMAEQEDG